MAEDIVNDLLKGYRMDFKNNKLESLPHRFDPSKITPYLNAVRSAAQMGHKMVDSATLAGMLLMEGREDFGYNSYNHDNREAKALFENLVEQGHNPRAAGMAAAILDKRQVAERLEIPFGMAWNGAGVNRYGQSGRKYATKLDRMINEGLPAEENQELVEFINNTLNPPPPPPPPPPPAKEPSFFDRLKNLIGENSTDVAVPEEYSPGGRQRLI